MTDGIEALSEREKEALRLLLGGHAAKSIARELDLSVHTVNERLRDARRKLGVSSSREAARLLGEAEKGTPNSLGDKQLGVARTADGMARTKQGAGHSVAWLAGGMLIMSLIIAAVVLSSMLQGTGANDRLGVQTTSVATSTTAARSVSVDAAREWATLVDGQKWEESWRAASALFRSQVTAAQWASSVRPVRQPLGAATSRTFQSVTKANALPNAPAGEYELIQFATQFANKSDAVETVVMVREGSDWKVAGYFIR